MPSIREVDGSVAKALEGKFICGVEDRPSEIILILNDGMRVRFTSGYRMGADGGHYNEMIVAISDGGVYREIAWR
jgi:hypothetical protein